MKMFKKGDQVRVTGPVEDIIAAERFDLIGQIGIVLEDSYEPYVEFGQPIRRGHSACGLGKNGRCWAVKEHKLELVNQEAL